MHTQKTAMTTNYQHVAVRLAGVDDLEYAHAGKPDGYGSSAGIKVRSDARHSKTLQATGNTGSPRFSIRRLAQAKIEIA
jgi:hypothetical protein